MKKKGIILILLLAIVVLFFVNRNFNNSTKNEITEKATTGTETTSSDTAKLQELYNHEGLYLANDTLNTSDADYIECKSYSFIQIKDNTISCASCSKYTFETEHDPLDIKEYHVEVPKSFECTYLEDNKYHVKVIYNGYIVKGRQVNEDVIHEFDLKLENDSLIVDNSECSRDNNSDKRVINSTYKKISQIASKKETSSSESSENTEINTKSSKDNQQLLDGFNINTSDKLSTLFSLINIPKNDFAQKTGITFDTEYFSEHNDYANIDYYNYSGYLQEYKGTYTVGVNSESDTICRLSFGFDDNEPIPREKVVDTLNTLLKKEPYKSTTSNNIHDYWYIENTNINLLSYDMDSDMYQGAQYVLFTPQK